MQLMNMENMQKKLEACEKGLMESRSRVSDLESENRQINQQVSLFLGEKKKKFLLRKKKRKKKSLLREKSLSLLRKDPSFFLLRILFLNASLLLSLRNSCSLNIVFMTNRCKP